MAADEVNSFRQNREGLLHDIALGAARVGYDGACLETRADMPECFSDLANWGAYNYQIGLGRGGRDVEGVFVDGAQNLGAHQPLLGPPDADHPAGQSMFFRGHTEGPADQAHSDDGNRIENGVVWARHQT